MRDATDHGRKTEPILLVTPGLQTKFVTQLQFQVDMIDKKTKSILWFLTN